MSTLALPRSGHDPQDIDGTMAMQQLIDWNNHAIGVWMQGQPEHAERLLWTAMTNLEEHQQLELQMHQQQQLDLQKQVVVPSVHRHQAEEEDEEEKEVVLMMTTEDEHLDVQDEDELEDDDEEEETATTTSMTLSCSGSEGADEEEEYRSIASVDLSMAVPLPTKQPDSASHSSSCDMPLFHRGLVLAPTASVEEITAVLGYNAALYHHSQALRGVCSTTMTNNPNTTSSSISPRQMQLQTCLQYYDGVWQLLQQHGWIDELLVMALFYNMGHAHWQLKQKEQAMFCMDFLQQVLKDSPAHMMVCQALQQQSPQLLDDVSTCHDDHVFFVVHALHQFEGEPMDLAPAA